MSREEFLAMNRVCTYPVAVELATWRYESLKSLPGRVFLGLKDSKGEWVSLIAGRSHHEITEIDWQMNRAGLPEYSLSTAMRSYLLEHEVAKGTRKLHFEGGTPHSIRRTLLRENVVDLIALRRSPVGLLLRRLTRRFAPENNYLTNMLSYSTVEWKRW
jgi:hypothetical protein